MVKNSKLKISIIIPIYNAERHLRECIESIISQSYKDWEMICINDGSTDGSRKILEEYASNDNRIKIICKQNEGVSIARNVGIKTATGEFIYFVDADDVLNPDALNLMLKCAEQYGATLVRADYSVIKADGTPAFINKKYHIRSLTANKLMTADDFCDKVLMNEHFLWVCLFRMDIVKKNNIHFIPQCRLMEDTAFIIEYLLNSGKNIYMHEQIYKYRKYNGGATGIIRDYTHDLKDVHGQLESMAKYSFVCKAMKRVNHAIIAYSGTDTEKRLLHIRYAIERIDTMIKYQIAKYIVTWKRIWL